MVLGRLLIIESEPHRSRALSALLQSWGFITSTQTDHTLDHMQFGRISHDLILFTGFLDDEACHRYQTRLCLESTKTLIFSQSTEDYKRLNLKLDETRSIVPPDWKADFLRQKILDLIESGTGGRILDNSTGPLGYKYFFAGWSVDMEQHIILRPTGETIILAPAEFSLLRAFIAYPRRVLTRNQILDLTTTMGSDVTDRVIDAQICRLRRRLMDANNLICTVRNEGYMFTERVHRVLSI
jgi:two-component system OmpR family response regulator